MTDDPAAREAREYPQGTLLSTTDAQDVLASLIRLEQAIHEAKGWTPTLPGWFALAGEPDGRRQVVALDLPARIWAHYGRQPVNLLNMVVNRAGTNPTWWHGFRQAARLGSPRAVLGWGLFGLYHTSERPPHGPVLRVLDMIDCDERLYQVVRGQRCGLRPPTLLTPAHYDAHQSTQVLLLRALIRASTIQWAVDRAFPD